MSCAKGYEVAFLGETYLPEANTTDYYTPPHIGVTLAIGLPVGDKQKNKKGKDMKKQQNKKVIDIFRTIRKGEVLTFPEKELSLASLRTYGGMLNSMAGYTKYSISRDRLLKVIRVKYNDEQ